MAFIVKIPGVNGSVDINGKGSDSGTNGCEKAGNAILKELERISTNEQGKVINSDLLDLEEIHLDNSNLGLTNKLIYENAFELFETKPKTIFLGGDHSISYSIGRAFLDYCQNSGIAKEPCLIVFDAHPDLLLSINEPNHREWLRRLIEEGFPAENILLVGVRSSEKEENQFIKENKIKTISINQLRENLEDMCEVIMEFSHGKELYVSLDIDVVDPAFAPATCYKEPGGLTSREIIYLMQRINKIKNLKVIDIVEINQEKDKNFDNMTLKLGAKILAELI